MLDSVEFGPIEPFYDAFVDATYVLNPREVEAIDRAVRSVIRTKAIAAQIFSTLQIYKGATDHKFSKSKDPLAPVFSKDFRTWEPGVEAVVEETWYLQGVHKDYYLSMPMIDASRNSRYYSTDILTRTVREFTALVADYKERMIWRGADIASPNPGNIDDNVLGLCTVPGTSTFEAGIDDDDNITAIGDGPYSIAVAAADLITADYPPPFVLVVTPGVYAQFLKNQNTTTGRTDYQYIMDLGRKEGVTPLISNIYFTKHLLNAAETTTTGAMYLIAPKEPDGSPTVRIVESYPLWHYPMKAGYDLGIVGKILWMGTIEVIRKDAITKAEAITIDSIA